MDPIAPNTTLPETVERIPNINILNDKYEYMIIQNSTPPSDIANEFAKDINRSLLAGWKLYGNLNVVHITGLQIVYVQALIRKLPTRGGNRKNKTRRS